MVRCISKVIQRTYSNDTKAIVIKTYLLPLTVTRISNTPNLTFEKTIISLMTDIVKF